MALAGVVVRLVGGSGMMVQRDYVDYVGGDVKFGAQNATMLVTVQAIVATAKASKCDSGNRKRVAVSGQRAWPVAGAQSSSARSLR